MSQIQSQGVVGININEEMKNAYLDYAMSVIVSRALPDVRDGMKPVHRRVLYAMYEHNNVYNKVTSEVSTATALLRCDTLKFVWPRFQKL